LTGLVTAATAQKFLRTLYQFTQLTPANLNYKRCAQDLANRY